nr:type IV secretory pathway, VirD4 components [Bradyrhizobium sp. DOA9]
MLDEFPALGRLDFFESALAFMADYGNKSFLIAQLLNQIEKACGPNNSISTIVTSGSASRPLTKGQSSGCRRKGMATEMKVMKNHAGSRLAPWLDHLMVSR